MLTHIIDTVDLKFKTERLDARKQQDIARAAHILRAGGTVAFPTETVYGLGANAFSPEAVAKIFAAKQRPSWDPLIVHIYDRAMLTEVATLSKEGHPDRIAAKPHNQSPAQALMDAFWPGPLTLLLPRTPAIPDAVTAGRPLVGVRMPAHPVALELIRQAGIPIAAPSANTFGHTSPTTAAHVLADLDGRIDAVLDGGPTAVGLESTVVGLSPEGPIIYRPGAVTTQMLDSVLCTSGSAWGFSPSLTPAKEEGALAPAHFGPAKLYVVAEDAEAPVQSLPSPGVGLRHYAPAARLVLVAVDAADPQHSLLVSIAEFQQSGEIVGAMLPDSWAILPLAYAFPWGPWHHPETLAQRLFAGLRDLDSRGATTIICPLPSPGGLHDAIRDRLLKAAM